MKSYFASKNEIGIKKGQQVYPRKEAFEMMDEETRRWYSLYSNYEYFSPYYLPKFGWTYVSDNNVPICVDDEKDAFREWLVHGIGSQNIYTRDYILLKYDELNGKAPQEPKPTPKFEVGDEVIATGCGGEKTRGKVLKVYNTPFGIRYDVCMKTIGIISQSWQEYELSLAPKTKLVFSLEKWVEKRMKVNGAKYIVENIGDWKSYDGHTVSFFSVLETLYDTDPDLFVEAEE
jgi:hypothetical protein